MTRLLTVLAIVLITISQAKIELDSEVSKPKKKAEKTKPKEEATAEKKAESIVKDVQPNKEDTLFRPGYKGDKPDEVEFAMHLKKFLGFEEHERRFGCDMVLSLKWTDKRAIQMIPEGAKTAVMPSAEAKKKIWMPDMKITNQALSGGSQVVSSMVEVYQDGTVSKVERITARIYADMGGRRAFPFDKKHVQVRIASATLMLDGLKLVPSKEGVETGSDAFIGAPFNYKSGTLREFEEVDGLLRKSRGELDILLARATAPYVFSIIVPTILMTSISWGAFFIPIAVPPYLMPRIACTLVTFLALLTHAIKIESSWGGEGDTWMDAVQNAATIVVFSTVLLNVFVLTVEKWVDTDMAAKMDSELRKFLPCVCLLVGTLCFFITSDALIPMLAMAIRLTLLCAIIGYFAFCMIRIKNFEKKD